MNLIKRLNRALDYIENNLDKELSVDEIAKEAYISAYHFQSMFAILTDITLIEYIRRRRLTQAAFELQSNAKVIDVALKYGYSSPDSFTRAFTKLHGVNPSTAKREDTQLKLYSRISFQINIKGDVEMNYKIVKKESFSMYGIERIINTVKGENYKTIPQFWDDTMEDGSFKRLLESTNMKLDGSYQGIAQVNAIMCYRDTGKDTFPYLIGAFVDDLSNTDGYLKVDIESLTWAIFRTEDHKSDETVIKIQDLWRRIYSEWLPNSGYEIIDGPNLELYGSSVNKLEYSEVWLPVKKI
ncbi:AraC family transcriptional regulator [Mycoplasmatota bacterium zrk1]